MMQQIQLGGTRLCAWPEGRVAVERGGEAWVQSEAFVPWIALPNREPLFFSQARVEMNPLKTGVGAGFCWLWSGFANGLCRKPASGWCTPARRALSSSPSGTRRWRRCTGPRRFSLKLLAGGYVERCKAYRQTVRAQGGAVPLAQKLARQPKLDPMTRRECSAYRCGGFDFIAGDPERQRTLFANGISVEVDFRHDTWRIEQTNDVKVR